MILLFFNFPKSIERSSYEQKKNKIKRIDYDTTGK